MCKRFSEFAKKTILNGEKIKIEKVANREILVKNFAVKNSNYKGKYATIQFELNNELYVIFTGSEVLIEQLEEYKEELPFYATITKINKYYSFS